MSDAAWIALASVATSLISAAVSLFNRKAIAEVHHLTNSRMDQLLKAVRKEGHAAGVEEEKERKK